MSENRSVQIWKVKDKTNWVVVRKASPGSVEEVKDLLYSKEDDFNQSNNVIAIRMGPNKKLGVAVCGTIMCSFELVEFLDNDKFTVLDDTISSYNPKAIYLVKHSLTPEFGAYYKKLKNNKKLNIIEVNKPSNSLFTSTLHNSVLKDIQKLNTMRSLELATSCVVVLIDNLNLCQLQNKFSVK
eukprot:UN27689